jgi:anti-sigma B factor antagonist
MSALEFKVNTAELDGNAFVVTVAGEVDMYTAPALEQALEGVVGLGGTTVVLDLTEVSFIDSTLLSVLLRYRDRLNNLGGELAIVTDDRRIRRTFEITGLDRIFTIEPRLADAIRAVVGRSDGQAPSTFFDGQPAGA